jgi:hypothetical protein
VRELLPRARGFQRHKAFAPGESNPRDVRRRAHALAYDQSELGVALGVRYATECKRRSRKRARNRRRAGEAKRAPTRVGIVIDRKRGVQAFGVIPGTA